MDKYVVDKCAYIKPAIYLSDRPGAPPPQALLVSPIQALVCGALAVTMSLKSFS